MYELATLQIPDFLLPFWLEEEEEEEEEGTCRQEYRPHFKILPQALCSIDFIHGSSHFHVRLNISHQGLNDHETKWGHGLSELLHHICTGRVLLSTDKSKQMLKKLSSIKPCPHWVSPQRCSARTLSSDLETSASRQEDWNIASRWRRSIFKITWEECKVGKLTQGDFIFGCEDIIQIDFWDCGSHHIKDIAGDLGSRVCQLVEGVI